MTAGQAGRGYVGTAVLLLAVGLGACTQDEPDTDVTAPTFFEFSPSPSSSSAAPTASPEPSVEPTVAAPPLPELATQQTPESAVAFTEWWFATLNYAYATGDTGPLRGGSVAGCGSCESLADTIDVTVSGGGEIRGGLVVLSQVFAPPGQSDPARVEVFVAIDQAEGAFVQGDGTEVAIPATAARPATMQALWTQDKWGAAGVIPTE